MSRQSPTYPRNVFSVLDVTINLVLYGTSRFDIPGHESNVSASFDARAIQTNARMRVIPVAN
jgi:hypothetical protein